MLNILQIVVVVHLTNRICTTLSLRNALDIFFNSTRKCLLLLRYQLLSGQIIIRRHWSHIQNCVWYGRNASRAACFTTFMSAFMFTGLVFFYLTDYCAGIDCSNIAKTDLTYWGRDKMAAFFQTLFLKTFSWMKMYDFDLDFTEVCS